MNRSGAGLYRLRPWINGDDNNDEAYQDEAGRLVNGNEFGELAHEWGCHFLITHIDFEAASFKRFAEFDRNEYVQHHLGTQNKREENEGRVLT